MKPLKALKGYIRDLSNLELHILLTFEDEVIVARCLDFSVSSHGNTEGDALASLADSLKNYLNYALEKEAFNEIIDPDEDQFWKIYQKLELQNETIKFQEIAKTLKKRYIKEIAYA
ncbi:MAG: hypothetical protein DRR19_03360 [Candidatus Parabeggiatoa sp. nov. 1]|nr:MAG: hypothetical protein DRR19_03360 [Gammaproteobacteria bacterium]